MDLSFFLAGMDFRRDVLTSITLNLLQSLVVRHASAVAEHELKGNALVPKSPTYLRVACVHIYI